MDHMPYMPFPSNYPVYIPRDKIANWLEFYADTMEINIWNSTEFTEGSYDEAEDRWTLKVRRADGSEPDSATASRRLRHRCQRDTGHARPARAGGIPGRTDALQCLYVGLKVEVARL